MTDPLRYDLRDGIATLTIDHPPVNILSRAVLEALREGITKVENEPRARVLILASGVEKAFAAGADIREMAGLGPPEAAVHGARGQGVTVALEELPIPVIAAVHGACLGGGCEIALACDFIVASDDARFGQPEIDLGIMPGWGGTQRLPRRIGPARAREWIMTGRAVSASDAMAMGLVLKVVARAELTSTAESLARELATKSATALRAAKRALAPAIDRALASGLALELDLWKDLFGTEDQREGLRAFLEKRTWTPAPRTTGEAPR